MKSMEKRQVEMDLTKIFLTPPNTRKEKITLLVMLVAGPICFSAIPPVKAVLLACMPSFSLSWGWIVLLRSLFRKEDFAK